MAGGAKGFSHALLSARQHIATCAHCATNQYRLTSQLENRDTKRIYPVSPTHCVKEENATINLGQEYANSICLQD